MKPQCSVILILRIKHIQLTTFGATAAFRMYLALAQAREENSKSSSDDEQDKNASQALDGDLRAYFPPPQAANQHEKKGE